MAEGSSNQILLIAPDLLGGSLALQLNEAEKDRLFLLRSDQLSRHPSLVIWYVENIEIPRSIQIELKRLQNRWQPSPVLLLLPEKLNLTTNQLLQFDCAGILQGTDFATLKDAIETIIDGGRVVNIKDNEKDIENISRPAMGLGEWLLLSGIHQINIDLKIIEKIRANNHKADLLQGVLLNGRERELKLAKKLIYRLWSSPAINIESKDSYPLNKRDINNISNSEMKKTISSAVTNIKLRNRDSQSIWAAVVERMETSLKGELTNSTGNLLALEELNTNRQSSLLLALLTQLDQFVKRLQSSKENEVPFIDSWLSLQSELREQALREMVGNYIRLPKKGVLTRVSEGILSMVELVTQDNELPDPELMLDPLLKNRPVLCEGLLLPADDPRALIQLEMLFSNWLLRTAELISEEILEACADWPELRPYILKPRFVSTRELEKVRNHLNSQNRWQELIRRPIQLYESKRMLYKLNNGEISSLLITEPRDDELRQLDWWQQQVALLVEAKDALSPQMQSLIKRIGNLMVVILTQIIGRAIGLVGRGIAQGMGRSLSRG